jgi:hypothetical protein
MFLSQEVLCGGFPPGLPVYNYRCPVTPVSSPSTVILDLVGGDAYV